MEIYNKPRFAYRDECAVILLVNAWELLLKATLSRGRRRLYYPKRPGEPYRSLGWADSSRRVLAEGLWPGGVESRAVLLNVQHLATFRDNAVHYYNAKDFGVLVHALAQQSIINFRDYLRAGFSLDLADEVSWALMPLGVTPPVDPVTYLRTKAGSAPSQVVRQFLDDIEESVGVLRGLGEDPSRLMTQLPVHLISIKKAREADAVVAVDPDAAARTIIKRVDPNVSHPLTTKQVLERVGGVVAGRPFTSNAFYAVAFHRSLRSNPNLHYRPRAGSPQWSEDVVPLLRGLSAAELEAARKAYRDDNAKRPAQKK